MAAPHATEPMAQLPSSACDPGPSARPGPATDRSAPPTREGPDHLVAVLAPNLSSPFELSVACEVFGFDRSELVDPWYRFRLCALDPPEVRTDVGFSLHTPFGLADAADADTVIVPVWPGLDEPPDDAVLDVLRGTVERGGRVLSFCTGAFALGHAGVLDGRRATTHWRYRDLFAAVFPSVELEPDALYVDECPVLTSAGTAAAIDLSLHVVRQDHGADVANAVARRMVVPPHRDGGQAQFVEAPVAADQEPNPLQRTLDWALAHLDEPLTVEDLARQAKMSPRTLARRFRQVTGDTPLQWLLHQRVLAAQRLLERTDESVEEIARRCGFGSAGVLREHFVRHTRTTPTAYRRTFTGGLEATG